MSLGCLSFGAPCVLVAAESAGPGFAEAGGEAQVLEENMVGGLQGEPPVVQSDQIKFLILSRIAGEIVASGFHRKKQVAEEVLPAIGPFLGADAGFAAQAFEQGIPGHDERGAVAVPCGGLPRSPGGKRRLGLALDEGVQGQGTSHGSALREIEQDVAGPRLAAVALQGKPRALDPLGGLVLGVMSVRGIDKNILVGDGAGEFVHFVVSSSG